MRFEFATAGRVLFGPDSIKEIESIVRDLGRRALIVRGSDPERSRVLEGMLEVSRVEFSTFEIQGEPTIKRIEEGVAVAREFKAEMVIGLGGGSVIDSAKAIAGLATNTGLILDYLEVIGKGKPLSIPSLPSIAIPTTAGTGAEVTRNSVLSSPEKRVKVSLRSPYLLPRFAIVDPNLTLGLPPAVTASTGLDALTQLIEPYVCIRANPMTDGFCLEGMRRAARSLRRAYLSGQDSPAREDMALASLFGGFSLANAGLGAVHGFASPIGGTFHAPHGAVCAALLPHVMDINIRAIRERSDKTPALERYETIARILTESPTAAATEGIQWVAELCHELNVPRLRTYGIAETDFPALVESAAKASSMKANPIVLTADELTEALHRAL